MSTSTRRWLVKDVMSREVVTASPDDTLQEALQLMVENRVSSLPVTDRKGHCLGMLSSTDLIELTRELDEDLSSLDRVSDAGYQWLLERLRAGFGSDKVRDHMSQDVAMVAAESELAQAALQMLRYRVHRLPVTDSSDRVLGIVSSMDVLRAFADGACSQA